MSSKGRVKVALEGQLKRKKVVSVDSRAASFETLFSNGAASTADAPPQASPEALQAAQEESPQAAPMLQAAQEAEPLTDDRRAISVADSDAESDHPASARHDSEDEEPLAPKPKRKRNAKEGPKAVKKRPANALPPPQRRKRRKVPTPSGQDVD